MSNSSTLLSPVGDDAKLKRIVDAISEIDGAEFLQRANSDAVTALSSNTEFEALEVSPEAVFEKKDGGFEASAIVYVTLNYGGKNDKVSMPDSYPAVVEGTIDREGHPSVDRIQVDTSSFYE
jgi:hypothetical protein